VALSEKEEKMNHRVASLVRRSLMGTAATGVLTAAALGLAPSAFADTGGICTPHRANTATWANCQSIDGRAHWARLITTCDIPAIGNPRTTTTGKWKLVPAAGSITISGNCTFKAVRATVQWRPY
jgi:hypothetical protein